MQATTHDRVERAFASPAFDPIRKLTVNEARPEDFQAVIHGPLRQAALNYARRLHNYAQDMGWLIAPIMTEALWPKAHVAKRRAITAGEHVSIVASEGNLERRAFYEVIWLTGGSQSDIAGLTRENVDDGLSPMVYPKPPAGSSASLSLAVPAWRTSRCCGSRHRLGSLHRARALSRSVANFRVISRRMAARHATISTSIRHGDPTSSRSEGR